MFLLSRTAHLSAARLGFRAYATKNPLPAAFLRGGTSKGIYINQKELPPNPSEWHDIFLGIMGSPDSSGRQLNGMGGGISSLSKICVVGPPTVPNADVDYAFAQVGIKDAVIDYAGNCGNLSCMIGVFAVDEGLVSAGSTSSKVVRAYNTNTKKIIQTTFPLTDGVADLGRDELPIAGVARKGSAISMEFLDPAGAKTGKLLPAGSSTVELTYADDRPAVRASLVDATNPTVFVEDLDGALADQAQVAEVLRQEGAKRMGLDWRVASQPKIAFIRPTDSGIAIKAYSMGVMHKAVPMTVALCLGVTANVEGTIAYGMLQERNQEGIVEISHPGG
ncbi:DUF453-domain-containing protein, partial [Cylindrobasidium torrendii FP15055 ss-10]